MFLKIISLYFNYITSSSTNSQYELYTIIEEMPEAVAEEEAETND